MRHTRTDRDDPYQTTRSIPDDRSIETNPTVIDRRAIDRSIESNPNPNLNVVVLARVASRWRAATRVLVVLVLLLVVVDRRGGRGDGGGDLARVRRARGAR